MPARRRVNVRTLREAAQTAVERTSLRAVARNVGISPPGLALFLDGATPREKTPAKLRGWYLSEAATRTDLTTDGARMVIDLLLESLTEGRRPKVFRKIAAAITGAHRADGTVPPSWLRELSGEEHAGGTAGDGAHSPGDAGLPAGG
jgi:hypothetical protein